MKIENKRQEEIYILEINKKYSCGISKGRKVKEISQGWKSIIKTELLTWFLCANVCDQDIP